MGEKRLTFNLATQSLNGVAIDDPFDKIRLFGRPENREPFARQIFDYPHLGLEIGGENGRVKYFSFAMRHLPSAEAKPCELTFVGDPKDGMDAAHIFIAVIRLLGDVAPASAVVRQ